MKKKSNMWGSDTGRGRRGVTKSLLLSHGVISFYEDSKRVGGWVDVVEWGQEFNSSMTTVCMYKYMCVCESRSIGWRTSWVWLCDGWYQCHVHDIHVIHDHGHDGDIHIGAVGVSGFQQSASLYISSRSLSCQATHPLTQKINLKEETEKKVF